MIPFNEVTQVRKQNTAVVFADTIVLGTRSRHLVTFSSLRNRQVEFQPYFWAAAKLSCVRRVDGGFMYLAEVILFQANYELIMDRIRTVDYKQASVRRPLSLTTLPRRTLMLPLETTPFLCGNQAGNEVVQFDMEGVDLGAEPDASTSGPVISTVGFGVQGPYMLPR